MAAIARPGGVERRELSECSDCGASFLIVYAAEPEEVEDLVAVACPECGWGNFARVAHSAAAPLQPRYRVEPFLPEGGGRRQSRTT